MSWPKSWILWFLPNLHLRINGYWLFVDTNCRVIEKIGCISWKSGLVSVTVRKKFPVFPSFEAMFVPSKSFRITFQCCPAFLVWEAWPPAFSESSEKKLAFHRKPKCLAFSLAIEVRERKEKRRLMCEATTKPCQRGSCQSIWQIRRRSQLRALWFCRRAIVGSVWRSNDFSPGIFSQRNVKMCYLKTPLLFA